MGIWNNGYVQQTIEEEISNSPTHQAMAAALDALEADPDATFILNADGTVTEVTGDFVDTSYVNTTVNAA